MAFNTYLVSFLLFISFSNIAILAADSNDLCVYTIYVQTGTKEGAGTDAKVSANFSNHAGESMNIPDLETWGIMPPGHDYFENGNLDTFSLAFKCFENPICSLYVSHDNSGNRPGWYVDYVDILPQGSSRTHFKIDRWLAKDEYPYETFITVDDCVSKYEKRSNGGIESVVAATAAT